MYDITYMSQPIRNLFGRLLGRFLSNGEGIGAPVVEQALADHRHANRQLAGVLFRMGILESADLDVAFTAHTSSMPVIDALRSAAGVRQLLGNLLIKNGHIKQEQLDKALREQKQSGELLGDVLIRLGYIAESEREEALAAQREMQTTTVCSAFKLGDILIASGQITRKQLIETLELQKHSGKKIGELLVDSGYAQQNQVEQGLRLQYILVSAALGTFMAIYPPVNTEAAGSSAGLYVTASVKKSARTKVVNQQHLVINADNIAQGYLEVTAADRVEVRNNSLSGYMITFEVREGPFRNLSVKGLGTELQINFGSGWVLRPHTRKPEVLELTYRFTLPADIKPGTYPWPVQISATAI
jgi:hypothetical protein